MWNMLSPLLHGSSPDLTIGMVIGMIIAMHLQKH
jgi:hypothetical protein